MKEHQPAEKTESSITVRIFRKGQRLVEEVSSIPEAVEEIEDTGNKITSSKISIDCEIVYNSERNGDIETWKQEWKRQKRTLSVDVEAHDCPHGTVGCNKDSLCLDCKFEKARE